MALKPYLRYFLAYALAATVLFLLTTLLARANPVIGEVGRYLYAALLIGGVIGVLALAAMRSPTPPER